MASESDNPELRLRKLVRPRVRVFHTRADEEPGETVAIDWHIEPLLGAAREMTVQVVGRAGSGKTCVLRYLAQRYPDAPWTLRDAPQGIPLPERGKPIVIFTSGKPLPGADVTLEIAPWTDDDCAEYLLANYPVSVKSVMARVVAFDQRGELEGLPRFWVSILEHLAANEASSDIPAAILQITAAGVRTEKAFRWLTEFALEAFFLPLKHAGSAVRIPFIDNHYVRALFAAHRFIEQLHHGTCAMLGKRFPARLVEAIAARLRRSADGVELLESHLASPKFQANLCMMLLAVKADWTPQRRPLSTLRYARLGGARWAGVELPFVDGYAAIFTGADLAGAKLAGAVFTYAGLSGASFRRAALDTASFADAKLVKTDFTEASLRGADFAGATITGANFTSADLQRARFLTADFTTTTLDEALFELAHLQGCDFEGMEMEGTNFMEANLSGALFTGSRVKRGNFRGANLYGAGLADIDWPEADLRDADLTHASFHMGSSRSGLVNSPLASEGTRTGFYADDYSEQDYKAPEEIRKANLCGADLRGAKVQDADFYLVDLRGAKYTEEQREHFARCGAILHERAAR